MRIIIHPLFFVVVIITIIYSATIFLFALLAAVLLHEFAHAMTARYFGVASKKFVLMPFGGAMEIECSFLTSRQKNIILLAGPIVSLLASLIFGVIVWLFPEYFIVFEYLVSANFLIGAMNLLPIYPLDGGKMLSSILKPKTVLAISNMTFIILLIHSVVSFNFIMIFFSVLMLIQINFEYKKITYKSKFAGNQIKTGKFTRCAILSHSTLFSAYKMINKRYPTEFVVLDKNNKVFYETDLEKWLLLNSLDTKICDCF